jgi:hypothetical protein
MFLMHSTQHGYKCVNCVGKETLQAAKAQWSSVSNGIYKIYEQSRVTAQRKVHLQIVH